MRFFVAAASMALVAGEKPNYEEMWSNFKLEYSKTYESNRLGDDEGSRFQIFKDNVDKINGHNAKNLSYRFGVNAFADQTAEEFAAYYLGGYRAELRSGLSKKPAGEVSGNAPDAIDWVDKGGVTPVKNQGRCGSCWAFSTTGAVEGAYFAASGKLVSLSEEDLVQCDHSGDQGCQGGIMEHAFDWLKQNGGLCGEDDYPYSSGGGQRGTCRFPKCQPVVTVTGYVDVDPEDEDKMKEAVAQQPVSVAIEADKSVFQFYKSGVFDDVKCGQQLDHGVLVVGYGSDGQDYWKVKNSWGGSWGEGGYIRMARGKNQCGIAMQPTYPTGAEAAAPSPPGPGPSPPPPAGPGHYEDPSDGCQDDEQPVRVQGVKGSFCSPSCTNSDCPSDVPKGVTAEPTCLLRTPGGEKRCALECSSSSECGHAKCRHISGIGICTYNDGLQDDFKSAVLGVVGQEEIVV